jgi:hypothetical protein
LAIAFSSISDTLIAIVEGFNTVDAPDSLTTVGPNEISAKDEDGDSGKAGWAEIAVVLLIV